MYNKKGDSNMFNEDLLKELNEERKELGIDTKVFTRFVALAKYYQETHEGISEENMAEVIRESFTGYDYPGPVKSDDSISKAAFKNRKRINDCFNEALRKVGFETIEGRKM